jgi:hypothetical protein
MTIQTKRMKWAWIVEYAGRKIHWLQECGSKISCGKFHVKTLGTDGRVIRVFCLWHI